MKNYWIFISVLFVLGCGDDPIEIEEVTTTFCDEIHRDESTSFATEWERIAEKAKNQTGVFVLEEGNESMVARAWMCEYAVESIDVQYFIFATDNVGTIAADYLLRAAERGVKVRILVDDIMVDAAEEQLLAMDAHENVSIKIYNPTANLGKSLTSKLWSLTSDFKGFNQRMHNKAFIVDGKAVITGGRNVADEYFDYDHEYNFRDRDVLLLGKVVDEVSVSFNSFWEAELSSELANVVTDSLSDSTVTIIHKNLHEYACDSANFWPQVREQIAELPTVFKTMVDSGSFTWLDDVTYVSDDPGKNEEKSMTGGGKTTDRLMTLVQGATRSVIIQSPYLVTTEVGQLLFKEAVDRGVEVKILTNSLASTDNLEAFNGYQQDRASLLEAGIRIFEYRPDAAIRKKIMTSSLQRELSFVPTFGLHAKSMVIDEEIVVIGTFNLDPRSANLNTECITIIRSKELAAKVLGPMNEEFESQNSWETTVDWSPDSVAGVAKQLKAAARSIVPEEIL